VPGGLDAESQRQDMEGNTAMSTATEQGTKVTTFTVKSEGLTEALKGAAAIAAGPDLPSLNVVSISLKEGNMVLTSTDRFRMVEGSIPLEDETGSEEEKGGGDSSILVRVADVKRIIDLLPKRGAWPVIFSRVGDMLSVAVGGDSLTVSLSGDRFPENAHIWATTEGQPVPLEKIGVTPGLMGGFEKVVGKKVALSWTFYGQQKPMRSDYSGGKVTWRLLLMPARVRD
jgi:DNA polymerase III sliding clamp (beta) subunit (PCNA family)